MKIKVFRQPLFLHPPPINARAHLRKSTFKTRPQASGSSYAKGDLEQIQPSFSMASLNDTWEISPF